MFAICFSCYLAAIAISPLIHHVQTKSRWPITFPFLPYWTVIALNLFSYCFTAWILFIWSRQSRGAERVFFAIWTGACLLSFVKGFVPPDLAISIQWAMEIGYVAMIFMAISVYRSIQLTSNRAPAPDSSSSA